MQPTATGPYFTDYRRFFLPWHVIAIGDIEPRACSVEALTGAAGFVTDAVCRAADAADPAAEVRRVGELLVLLLAGARLNHGGEGGDALSRTRESKKRFGAKI